MHRAGFALSLALSSMGSLAIASITNVVGPYNVTFHGAGETITVGQDQVTGAASWTGEQMSDIAACINTWDSLIGNTAARQLSLSVIWGDFGATRTLGSSSNPMVGTYTDAYSRTELVWREDYNYNAAGADATIIFSTNAAGSSWNFGTDAPMASQIDFRSVTMHELGHTLGFMSSYQNPTDTFWLGGLMAWDKNIEDSAGNKPLANGTGTPGDFDQTDNPVYFVGPNALAANGGQPIALYAPVTYEEGSSLTHLDEGMFTFDMMSPAIGNGQIARDPSLLDIAILKDLGWTIVPEPGLVGLLTVAVSVLAIRRRRSA